MIRVNPLLRFGEFPPKLGEFELCCLTSICPANPRLATWLGFTRRCRAVETRQMIQRRGSWPSTDFSRRGLAEHAAGVHFPLSRGARGTRRRKWALNCGRQVGDDRVRRPTSHSRSPLRAFTRRPSSRRSQEALARLPRTQRAHEALVYVAFELSIQRHSRLTTRWRTLRTNPKVDTLSVRETVHWLLDAEIVLTARRSEPGRSLSAAAIPRTALL